MGQRVCKVSPMVGEVYEQHLSTPPKPGINTAVQHPHPRDETPVGVGEGNIQERRVIERGDEEERKESDEEERKESGRVQEKRERRVMERGDEEERKESGEEERKESGTVQEKGKRKAWRRRLTSFLRSAKVHPSESSSGQQVEELEEEEEAGTSSDEYIFSHYSVGEALGKGGFGVVYEGRRLDDDLKVALKYVTKTPDMTCLSIPDHPNPLPSEIALHILANKGPSVPEIIRLLDWQDHPDHFVMVLEYPSPCENLLEFVKRQGGKLDEGKARTIMRQAARAANVCCRRGILHRDIKLENLLINSKTFDVKLIDFGCGEKLRSLPYWSYSGSAAYAPPEYYYRGMYYGRQATTWSLGVLMFAMLCGHFPTDYELHLLKQKRWSKNSLSSECCHLLNALLQDIPSRRLSLARILSHNWFKA